jgi:hypothetical protein
MRTLCGFARLIPIEHLPLHLSIKKHHKRPNNEIGSACSYANPWVRDYLLYVDIDLIYRTVDLKYVLSTQVVQIQYDGTTHIFSVTNVSTRIRNAREPESNIEEKLGSLSMNDATRLYIVDWDTTVAIEDNVQVPESNPLSVRNFSTPGPSLYLTTRVSLTWGFQTNPKALPIQPSED